MTKINLVIDIGNTHIVLGVFAESELKFSWRLSTDKHKTEDEYFILIDKLLSRSGYDSAQIKNSAISSVVPELTRSFSHLWQKYYDHSEIKIVNAYTNLGIQYPMADPGFIGSDLVVNAYAAVEKYHTNCIICDFGSATTIQLIGKDKYFYGTTITPGVITSVKNLFEKASLLSTIQLEAPQDLLGTTTQDALRSGIINGNAFMIDEFIRKIKQKYHNLENFKTIATGGISPLICEKSNEIDVIDKKLTLEGLNLICLNEKK